MSQGSWTIEVTSADEARKKILDDGFQFVKGKSRSKKRSEHFESSSDLDVIEPQCKRHKMDRDMRENRLKELDENVKDLSERISFKEKRITACLNISDFEACDEIKDSVIELKAKRRELKAELKHLMASIRKSKWYLKKKAASDSSGSSQHHNSTSSESCKLLIRHLSLRIPIPFCPHRVRLILDLPLH